MKSEHAMPEEGLLPEEALEHAPIMIGYVGRDLRYQFVNSRYADVLQRQRHEIVGRHVAEVLGDAAYETLEGYVRQALAGRRVKYQRWVDLPGGRKRFWSTTYQPHFKDGRVRGFFVYVLDATDRKREEEARRESEERFRAIFENAAVGIALVRMDGRVAAVNRQAAAMLGYSPDELLERLSSELGHPADEAKSQEAVRRLVSGEAERVDIEKRYFRRDGQVVWTHGSFSLLRDVEGRPSHFIGVIEDITARKEVEDALAASERRYRGVFENAAVGMARVSAEGQWLDVNNRLCSDLGYSREELLTLRFQDFTHPDDLAEDLRQAERLVRGDIDHYELDKRYLRKDGRVMWGHLTASSVRDDDGRLLYLVGIVEDISARKEAEAALHSLNLALESRVQERTVELLTVNQELDAFNYSVSHDLRAPLRGIHGFSQALLEDYGSELGEHGRRYLERVKAGAARMGELIDALLMLSRLSRSELRYGSVSLSEVARECAAILQAEDPRRSAIFVIPDGLIVEGDRSLLQVVVQNLLENAWKFTRHADPARIELGCESRGAETVCYVRDNGAGFDPQYSQKLFMPFQRLHNPREFEGHGIGLATVQRIVSRHGGRVWAESSPGQGATFYFTLAEAPD